MADVFGFLGHFDFRAEGANDGSFHSVGTFVEWVGQCLF
jgi:hypothetical protein